MRTLRYDPDGLHVIDLFADLSLMDLLPGLMATEQEPGDEWDESLMHGEPGERH